MDLSLSWRVIVVSSSVELIDERLEWEHLLF